VIQQNRGGEIVQLGPEQVGAAGLIVGCCRVIDRIVVPDRQLDGGRVDDRLAKLLQARQHRIDMRLGVIGAMRLCIADAQGGQTGFDGTEHGIPTYRRPKCWSRTIPR
jgi:hypothetical protein